MHKTRTLSMWNDRKRFGFLFAFMIGYLSIIAQGHYDYYTDTLTYSQYMKADWKSLYDSVKVADKQGVSFYYYELRAAFAAFHTQRYERAIERFSKAESFQKGDAIVNEYYYLSALYSGQRLAQIDRYQHLSEEAKMRYRNPQRKAVELVAIEIGYNFNTDYSTLNESSIYEIEDIYSERILLKDLRNNSLKLSHGILSFLTLNHSLHYVTLYKEQDFYAIETDEPLLKSFPISTQQIQYNVNATVNIKDQIFISPTYTYIKYNAQFYKAEYDAQYSFIETDLNGRQCLYGLMLQYLVPRFKLSAHTNYFKGEHIDRWQAGISSTFYINRDKTQYIQGSLDLLTNKEIDRYYVWSFRYGFNIKKYWLELNHTAGDLRNFTEVNGEIVYNTYEKILSKTGLNISRPIFNDHLWFSVYYRYLNYSSFSVYLDQNLALGRRNILHNNHSITGGLSWYF